jgi:hypothetical protein
MSCSKAVMYHPGVEVLQHLGQWLACIHLVLLDACQLCTAGQRACVLVAVCAHPCWLAAASRPAREGREMATKHPCKCTPFMHGQAMASLHACHACRPATCRQLHQCLPNSLVQKAVSTGLCRGRTNWWNSATTDCVAMSMACTGNSMISCDDSCGSSHVASKSSTR